MGKINIAQSFFVDPDKVSGAKLVYISSVDLYFKHKPSRSKNRSGIEEPGITAFIVPMTVNRVPDISGIFNGTTSRHVDRLEYDEISVSSDAKVPSKFIFNEAVPVETGKEYAIVLSYDGNEDFRLWRSRQGAKLVGTNVASAGPNGKYDGYYFDAIYSNVATASIEQIPNWKPRTDIDLKFSVNVARFLANGTPVDTSNNTNTVYGNYTNSIYGIIDIVNNNNQITYTVGGAIHEFVTYDISTSKTDIKVGEFVYQNTVAYPGGSANGVSISAISGSNVIVANTLLPNGSNFNWNSIYTSANNTSPDEFIVVVSNNDPSVGKRKVNVRQITNINSNTEIEIDRPLTFTNASANFFKSPIAQLSQFKTIYGYDTAASTVAGRRKKVISRFAKLINSNSNTAVRFVNNSIASVSIAAGGNAYSNSDYLEISGYEDNSVVKGGYKAYANIVTNANGTITAVYLSNTGAGFVNTANISVRIANSTGANSTGGAGNTASFTFTSGAMIIGESSADGGYLNNAVVTNLEYSKIAPYANLTSTSYTSHGVKYINPYYQLISDNTFSGFAYYSSNNVTSYTADLPSSAGDMTMVDFNNIPVIVSRSNEFSIVDDSTNAVSATPFPGTGVVQFTTNTSNDFNIVNPTDFLMLVGKFDINNDYTNENTDYGNAISKHITKKISFSQDRTAEDVVVYLTAYRPHNTDIKVFARLHNNKDADAFDDKDWTLLDLVSTNTYSSSAKKNDFIEYQYGLNNSPNTAVTLSGYVTLTSSNVTVTGSNTTFSANLLPNDLVKIYSPLFPENYGIGVVNNVSNNTSFNLSDVMTTSSLTGSGLQIDLIGRVGNSTVASVGYPLQAFKYSPNDNVIRYYNSTMSQFDGYNTLQLKIVMLSNIDQVSSSNSLSIASNYPRIKDIRAIGVTA